MFLAPPLRFQIEGQPAPVALFPDRLGTANTITEEQCAEIGDALTTDGKAQAGHMPASFTYFGQFITHDIVPETRSGGDRTVHPWLHLDSVYDDAYLKANPKLLDGPRFKLEPVPRCKNGLDLPRASGKALIPERRNDENVIVCQLHVAFLRLHNRLVDELAGNVDETDLFSAARRILIVLYQRAIRDDYLRQLLDPRVHDDYFRKGQNRLLPSGKPPQGWAVPVEFGDGCFRFAHSMVRHRYMLRADDDSRPIAELMRKGKPLTREHVIDDWAVLHDARSERIDTFLPGAMGEVPAQDATGSAKRLNLAEQDLLASRHLTSLGLNFDKRFSRVLGDYDMHYLSDGVPARLSLARDSMLKDFGVPLGDLPLWALTLLEASQTDHGFRLGLLGSIVVAEVLSTAMRGISPNGFSAMEEIERKLGKPSANLIASATYGGMSIRRLTKLAT